MTEKLSQAFQNVESSYAELVEIANGILDPMFNPINQLVDEINEKSNNLSIDQIRDYMLRLQLSAYQLSETRDKAALKAELAEAIQKEQFAIKFNSFEGAAAVKDKLATVAVSGETVSEILYNLVSSLLKTKSDQLHRLVAVLTSILMSKMSEVKFMNMGTTSEIPATVGRMYGTDELTTTNSGRISLRE